MLKSPRLFSHPEGGHPGCVGPGGGAGLRYNLLRADEHGKKLSALESSARAEAFCLLLATGGAQGRRLASPRR